MATERMEQDNDMEQDQGPETVFEDQISELPDAIILHILSFLPTLYAVRMSLLSKRWRRMWTMVPVLDFCDSRDIYYFRGRDERNNGRRKFYKFVNECLKHPFADTAISKFKLSMEYYGGSSRMDCWLRFPVEKHVKELDLYVRSRRSLYYLPHFMLHFRSLTLLKLNGLALEIPVPTSLPSLKELYLLNIQMDDKVLNNLLLSCTSIEKLHVNYCDGLLSPKVSSLSLKSMEFRTGGLHCYCRTIEVEAINLQSFVHSGAFYSKKCTMNLVHCRAIRNLSLVEMFLTDQWIEDLIPQLPFLESLELKDCCGLQRVKIWNQHLKSFVFTLRGRWDSLEATIDTPNLFSFSYSGNSMFKISVNAPNLADVAIRVPDYPRKTYDEDWYASLIKFLSEFNGSKKIYIFSCNEKALIIPDEVKKMYSTPLPDLEHVKVQTGGRPFRKVMLRKSLLWIAPRYCQ